MPDTVAIVTALIVGPATLSAVHRSKDVSHRSGSERGVGIGREDHASVP